MFLVFGSINPEKVVLTASTNLPVEPTLPFKRAKKGIEVNKNKEDAELQEHLD